VLVIRWLSAELVNPREIMPGHSQNS